MDQNRKCAVEIQRLKRLFLSGNIKEDFMEEVTLKLDLEWVRPEYEVMWGGRHSLQKALRFGNRNL